MSTYNQNHAPFVKIVYAKKIVNGRVELVPLVLYADGHLERNA
ncbi:MAG TPA: hypothetical protein V6C65_14895 [Allocoleopsis sp.]